MGDIFRYSAIVSLKSNRSPELKVVLQEVMKTKLESIAAHRVAINGSVVSFHGRASRLPSKDKRFVTNWNLLHMVARGAIQVKNNFPDITVSYWLGFPKAIFYQIVVWTAIMGMLVGILYFIVQPSAISSLLVAFGVMFVFLLLSLIVLPLSFALTIARFNLFIRYCMRAAEKQLQQ